MSEASEKLNEAGKLKRAIIDHMVITMVASVVSCFFFLVWHLYSRLEMRVSNLEKETSAALLVLKESSIEHKVRLDMLERDFSRRQEAPPPVAASHGAAPVMAAVPAPVPVREPSFWTPAPPRTNQVQQQSQQQQSFPMSAPPEMMQQRTKPLFDIQNAREELQKKINENKVTK